MKQFHDAKVLNTRLPPFVIPKITVVKLTHKTRIKDAVNMEDLICLLATVRTLNTNQVTQSLTKIKALPCGQPTWVWYYVCLSAGLYVVCLFAFRSVYASVGLSVYSSVSSVCPLSLSLSLSLSLTLSLPLPLSLFPSLSPLPNRKNGDGPSFFFCISYL